MRPRLPLAALAGLQTGAAVVLTLLAASASAAPPALQRAIRLYGDLDLAGSQQELRALLASSPTPHTAAVAHVYLGIIAMELDYDSSRAESEFRRAVALEPTVAMPLSAAPKERMVFVRAQRAEIEAETHAPAPAVPASALPSPAPPASPVPAAAVAETPPGGGSSHATAWWLGGTGAALAIAGTVLGVLAGGNDGSATGQPPQHSVPYGTYVTGQYEGLGADIAWSVGGALVVSAIIVAFTAH